MVQAAAFDSSRNFYADYEMGDLLGEGAYGRVYDAKHKTTAITYAVKVVSKEHLND